jgi:hypothetical protein
MGAHAHRVGLLHAALGHTEPAREWLRQALETHRRLGARVWQAETHQALATVGDPDAAERAQRTATLQAEMGLAPPAADRRAEADDKAGDKAGDDAGDEVARLRRVGDIWRASYRGHTAYIRDTKGMHDLAALLARPGADLSALSLAGGDVSDGATYRRARPAAADHILDRIALLAYRRRLAELNEELAAAQANSDLARREGAVDEREQLLAELRRATRPDGTSRSLANTASERARKAVTARIRDAIRRITDAHPDLGAHLDSTIRTGTTCRYEPRPGGG